MVARIERLCEKTLKGEMYVKQVPTAFSRMDLLLPDEERKVKRLCEYILNQEPLFTEDSALTGLFNFDGSVVGDAFTRSGHEYTLSKMWEFYDKPVDGFVTMEWQHATADFRKVLGVGIDGLKAEIAESLKHHTDEEEVFFLHALDRVADAFIGWAHKCSGRVLDFAANLPEGGDARARLEKLAAALLYVPQNPPRDFYEAILTLVVCFSADPDSFGMLDRYLAPFYEKGIADGTLTRGEAQEYLQELFCIVQARTPFESVNFTRGGESHFCVGGYLPNGEDAFCETSRLIVESVVDTPLYIPQLTLRVTEKTPREVVRFAMDKERHDPHKRIAFTNDEKRVKAYTAFSGYPFEVAVNYTTAGCNEPAFCGSIVGSTSKGNVLMSMARLFRDRREELLRAETFDAFFALYEQELCADLAKIIDFDNKFNIIRAGDISYISSLFMNGPIERAKSLTRGGCKYVLCSPMLIGISNAIDSLCAVKQFVYDEKRVSMAELCDALAANYEGYEDLRLMIEKKCDFFGNDGEISNEMARLFYDTVTRFYRGKTNLYGYNFYVGDLMGYHEHHVWFGEKTPATPDGRRDGEPLKFGRGQSDGHDREGLTALLSSIAKSDASGIGCGSSVTNISLDKKLVENDESFEKLVDAFITYFRMGGLHFQLNYVSAQELIAAQKAPEKHKTLRVRVSGFSDYFVNQPCGIQDEIISRTVKEG